MSAETTCRYCGHQFDTVAELDDHVPCDENVTDVHPAVVRRVERGEAQ